MTEEIMSSNVKIIHDDSNPYVMDMIKGKDIAALTKKNSIFIEAVLKLDSNYKRESEVFKPDEKFDLEKHLRNAKGLYCGSTQFWFDEMSKKESNYDYKQCVLGAVISIDRSNSTHLETTKNGRQKMADIISKKCPDLKTLKKELSKPFKATDNDHLISKMLNGGFNTNGKDMYYLSFASKFCSCAAECLNTKVKYSKYDDIVSKALPTYYEVYCGESVKKTAYKVDYSVKEKCKHRLELYENYSNAISEILGSLDENNKLTRDEFDHIIWYGMKGN